VRYMRSVSLAYWRDVPSWPLGFTLDLRESRLYTHDVSKQVWWTA
jgi:hypothetical protein